MVEKKSEEEELILTIDNMFWKISQAKQLIVDKIRTGKQTHTSMKEFRVESLCALTADLEDDQAAETFTDSWFQRMKDAQKQKESGKKSIPKLVTD